ncbi:MAG: hypothetical protein K0U12_04350, partial [Gammaproteobacteria bacterium]|nr:hypothetical protein [Gammaproteobacteria bacterium]
IVSFGSGEQQELFKLNMERQLVRNEEFFEPILEDFERRQKALASQQEQERQLRQSQEQELQQQQGQQLPPQVNPSHLGTGLLEETG